MSDQLNFNSANKPHFTKTLQYVCSNSNSVALDTFINNLDIPNRLIYQGEHSFRDFIPDEQFLPNELKEYADQVLICGVVDETAFADERSELNVDELWQERSADTRILLFGVDMGAEAPAKESVVTLTRALGRYFNSEPVCVLFRYPESLTLAYCKGGDTNKRAHHDDNPAKVSLLHDVDCQDPHPGHLRVLESLSAKGVQGNGSTREIRHFDQLNRKWRRVFRGDLLHEQFYSDHHTLTRELVERICPDQIADEEAARRGILSLLNRLLFLCFLQQKGWLMDDTRFLFRFWQDCQESQTEQDTFHEQWLNPLLYNGFNGQSSTDAESFAHLPAKYRETLSSFPYLNGSVFTRESEADDFLLPDSQFEAIFGFLERYAFTIDEDTAQVTNLEINPELLGKTYEAMINADDLDESDAEHGIVYTERPEIDFMTRRSFVEVLDNRLNGEVSREFLYHFVFDAPDRKQQTLAKYQPDIRKLEEVLSDVRSCDPACGSGSMLLGVMQLQTELLRAVHAYAGCLLSLMEDFQLKRRLISDCIYGIDIKGWAVEITKFRLWLSLIAEANIPDSALTDEPILPNLDFNIRCGNSLLPAFDEETAVIRRALLNGEGVSHARAPLNTFSRRKRQFIRNELPGVSFELLKREEAEAVAECVRILLDEQSRRFTDAEIASLEEIAGKVAETRRLPFSYDIDFMELFFLNADPGFDLMIGNPPYVRQENILPPEGDAQPQVKSTPDLRRQLSREYKHRLREKVRATYPVFHTMDRVESTQTRRLFTSLGKRYPAGATCTPIFNSSVRDISTVAACFVSLCPTRGWTQISASSCRSFSCITRRCTAFMRVRCARFTPVLIQ